MIQNILMGVCLVISAAYLIKKFSLKQNKKGKANKECGKC
jgi:hypothetical protein